MEAAAAGAAGATLAKRRGRARPAAPALAPLGPRAGAGCDDGPQPQQQQRRPLLQRPRPLSFSRWFARQARATDLVLILAEAMLMSLLHATRLGEALYCSGSGSSHGAGAELGPSNGSFPCGGGLGSRLLWSLSSGAVVDPVLRLQLCDFGGLLYTWTQLAVVVIALLAPALYERCRHALMAGVGVVMLLGVHWSLWAAPSAVVTAAAYYSTGRRRMGAVYMGWKSATVFRVPASVQRVTGPLLWLLTVTAMPLADRRMPPPGIDGRGSAGAACIAAHALLLFMAMAVLPYLLCRAWEARTLRPAYREYLRDCARAAAGSGGGGGAGGAADEDRSHRSCGEGEGGEVSGSSSGRSSPTCTTGGATGSEGTSSQVPSPTSTSAAATASGSSPTSTAVATACCAAATPSHSRGPWDVRSRSLDLPGGLALHALAVAGAGPQAAEAAEAAAAPGARTRADTQRSVLYRSKTMANGLLGRSRTALVSVKMPLPHRGSGNSSSLARSVVESSLVDVPTFEQASAAVLRSAAAALEAHNRAREQRRLPAETPMPSLRCLSAVCVEGCVQLLMVVHFMAAGGEEEGQQAEGPAEPGEEQGSGPDLLHVHHMQLPQQQGAAEAAAMRVSAAAAPAAVAAQVDSGDWERAAAEAAVAAVQQLLAQVGAGQLPASGSSATSSSFLTNGSDADVSAAAAAGASSSSAPASAAVCWPPALPLLPTPDGQAGAGAGQTEAEVVTVLLQLPAASARGLRSVRCVLGGPPAVPYPGGGSVEGSGGAAAAVAVAHVDMELPLHLLLQQPLAAGGEGGGSDGAVALAYVRLPVPPRARMGPAGLRMLHVLPPPPPPAHDAAAAATGTAAEDDSPFTAATMTTISPVWPAAGHGGGGQPAFMAAADALAGAPSSACGSAPDAYADASTSTIANSASSIAAFATTVGTASARSSMSGGPGSTAPLAVVPLLVVGPEAAAELQQLHGEVLEPAAVAQLQQLATVAVAGAAVSAPEDGSSNHSRGDGEALSGAAAALQHSGLTSLVLDFGALLQLPRSCGAGGACEEGVDGDLAAAGYGGLLRFLAAPRMAGCLREALAALERAGGRLLLLPGEEEEQEAEADAASPGGRRQPAVGTASDGLMLPAAASTDAPHMRAGAVMFDAAGAASTDAGGPSSGVHTPASRASDWGCCPAAAAKLVSTASGAATARGTQEGALASAVPVLPPLLPGQPGGSLLARLVWWLRVLALGFPRASSATASSAPQQARGQQLQAEQSPEAAYQAYKAASCRPLDCVSLVTFVVFRVLSLLRTCADAARGSAAAASVATGSGEMTAASAVQLATQQLARSAAQPATMEPGVCAAGACPRPYLEGCCGGVTSLQLEVAAQCIFLAAAVVTIVLAACTRLHARRRNAFLLLRAGLDAAALLLIMLPLPRWPVPLLGLPAWWLESNRHVWLHCLVNCMFEPIALQVSPYLQAQLELIRFVPATLYEFYNSGCRWRPALRAGLGHAALAVLVSAGMDAASRGAYLRRGRGGRR